MARKKIVAIVGKPNVGKSTLFNRIVKERKSIVDDAPGITRDRIYADAEWLNRYFILIDTGGITWNKLTFADEIRMQAEIAIEESDLILFVVNFSEGITIDDEQIAKLLYKTNKKIILVANKYDSKMDNSEIYNYLTLGFGEPILVSSSHSIGIGDLLDHVVDELGNLSETKTETNEIKFSIIGRPNVGKSSLLNAMLGENRSIVSPIAGTTTDAVDTDIFWNKIKYQAIDTAGIRRKGKIYEAVEKYSLIRSLNAVSRSDVVLLVLDATVPISDQDTNIGGIPFQEYKPVIIVVNKWDAVEERNENTKFNIEKEIKKYFKFLNYADILFVSALTKKRIDTLFKKINDVYNSLNTRIKTSILNEILLKAQLINPAPDFNGGRLKIYYATQPENKPPTFILFVNNPEYVHFSYKRFLENQIRDVFGFSGIPIKLVFRERK